MEYVFILMMCRENDDHISVNFVSLIKTLNKKKKSENKAIWMFSHFDRSTFYTIFIRKEEETEKE